MSIFQILAILFALFMLYVIRLHKKRFPFSFVEYFFWHILWIVFIILTLFPQLLTNITTLFFFDRIFDLLIVGALMIITFLVVATYLKYQELHQKIDQLVRKLAIYDNLKKRIRSKK